MKNSVLILAHLKAHKCKEPRYERTAKGVAEALGISTRLATSTICRLKQTGRVSVNPSRMLVGKHPNGCWRGMNRPAVYDITPKGSEWLAVNQ